MSPPFRPPLPSHTAISSCAIEQGPSLFIPSFVASADGSALYPSTQITTRAVQGFGTGAFSPILLAIVGLRGRSPLRSMRLLTDFRQKRDLSASPSTRSFGENGVGASQYHGGK